MDLERSLAHAALETHPRDAARVLERVPAPVAASLIGRASPGAAAEVLRLGAPHFASAVIDALPSEQAARALVATPAEVAARILRRVAEPRRTELLDQFDDASARTLRSLLRYPDGSAAALMDPHALALPEDVTVEEAIRRVRSDPAHALFYLYVLDREDVLVGVASLRDVLGARPEQTLGAIARSPVESVPAATSGRAVVGHDAWREFHSLPVVDERGCFLGAIRHRTFLELESELQHAERDPGAPTMQALGELFSTAVGGMLEAMAGPPASRPPARGKSQPR